MLNRLTMLHINLAGLFTALIIAGLLFLALIKPKQEDLQKTRADAQNIETQQHGTEAEASQHERDVKRAQQQQVAVEAQWQQASAEYMPRIPFQGTTLASYPLIADLPRQWGTWLASWYDVQRNQGVSRAPGVTFAIPGFPADPNYIASLNHITFPSETQPWTVTVEAKSFDDLMAHLRRFNTEMKHHGMPVINNVALSGQSPNLVGSYQLALYIIPPTKPPAEDIKIGSPGAGRAGGPGMGAMGMMGGYGAMTGRAGMMGGPPMGVSGGPGGRGGSAMSGGGMSGGGAAPRGGKAGAEE
ncbi:MAG TPA: hypothetical protein VFB38_16580 [Chthonomonadaceae bacterium]|nr:hypothetical protein [Chthonomonadaceae bacterium]